ncbi:MAG: transposase [Tannerellaceae bacterium]|jgi:hypothetical protein|nr:transposase [Tannerellaceae bacterium]
MERWVKQVFNTITPRSPLCKAISYAFGMWPRISRYCSDGRFEIDNNDIENAIRAAPGRKNCLFSGNDGGVEDNCIFYTPFGKLPSGRSGTSVMARFHPSGNPRITNSHRLAGVTACNYKQTREA